VHAGVSPLCCQHFTVAYLPACSNRIAAVDDDCLPPSLGWLILTDNRIVSLPRSFSMLTQLRKLMMATNELRELPDLSGCTQLELARFSDNRLRAVHPSLLSLPRLSWLALAGNPDLDVAVPVRSVPAVDFAGVVLGRVLGEGASGVVHEGEYAGERVAVKMFKAASSDGRPIDEVHVCAFVPPHANIVRVVGTFDAPKLGMVMEFLEGVVPLAGPPSFATVTRDVYPESHGAPSPAFVVAVLRAVVAALVHIHTPVSGVAVMHGDVYAHNILVQPRCMAAASLRDIPADAVKLSDFGAAFAYRRAADDASGAADASPPLWPYEMLEVRAFGCLVEELLERLAPPAADDAAALEYVDVVRRTLAPVAEQCMRSDVARRPTFAALQVVVQSLYDRLS
jgi:hypothetical protein